MAVHAEAHHHGPPAAHVSSRVDARLLGMFRFIASEVMRFGAFFTAYFFIRVVNKAPEWPPHPYEFPKYVAGVNTAILITFDESGGQYDSGYIQPIDFFGDGPRTVMIAVSPYAKTDYVDHTYGDHASILKFIELRFGLAPLGPRDAAADGTRLAAGGDGLDGGPVIRFDFREDDAQDFAFGVPAQHIDFPGGGLDGGNYLLYRPSPVFLPVTIAAQQQQQEGLARTFRALSLLRKHGQESFFAQQVVFPEATANGGRAGSSHTG